MTANIDPAHLRPQGSTAPSPSSGARPKAADGIFETALAKAERSAAPSPSPSPDIPPSPPPELAAHIAAAARAWEALAAAGQHVVFNYSDGGRFTIELQDDAGNHLHRLSGEQVFGLIDEHGGE